MSGDGKRRSRPRLPPSGLAEEVLGSLRERERTPEAEAEEPSAPVQRPGQLLGGADRLLLFTDSVQDEEKEEEPEELETWVLFRLEKKGLCLPVTHVREILRVGEITRVPHAPHPVRGVTNVRSRVVPVLDLRLRFGLPPASVTAASRLLALEVGDRLLGLLVDRVDQVVHLAPSRFEPPATDGEEAECARASYRLDETAAEAVTLLLPRKIVSSEEVPAGADDPSP